MSNDLRVLIVAEHASARFGGEAALALHYFRVLLKRDIPVWLVTHARTRNELEELFPGAREKMIFVPDTWAHLLLWRVTQFLPVRFSTFTTRFAMRFLTQLAQRRVIRQLVLEKGISVIHQPMPVSPKEPSMIFGMGVPVIIGPMNGGMDYPPAFRLMQGRFEQIALALGRKVSGVLNWVMPGKRHAAILLVANDRTRHALPLGVTSRVEMLVENGVDLSLWKDDEGSVLPVRPRVTRFIFLGRLVALKAVDLLLQAFSNARSMAPMSLVIVGDGDERLALERLASELSLVGPPGDPGSVIFFGWMSQAECAVKLRQSDVLVLPSLHECGGAVVLEAMAMGIPVIATNWGGPADYLDSTCGILIDPVSVSDFIKGLSDAMILMGSQAELRTRMGKAGRAKVLRDFDWDAKGEAIISIYGAVICAANK